jgi:isopenicillin-N N-acyltransferase-like protein
MTIARHHSTERHPADRGVGFGRAQRTTVVHTVATYRRLFEVDCGLGPQDIAVRGREVEARVRAFRPALAEEIEGIAAGSGEPVEALFAVNARTELLAGGAIAGNPLECSTVAMLDGDRALLAQNWDFHPDLAGSRVVWTIDEPGLTTFTEAGVVGKIGVNASGVALAINFLGTDADGGLDGVPVHVLARALLEEARTVKDARALIESTSVSASVAMTVAGPDADNGVTARAFELWPGGVAEVEPDRGAIAHTNHFLAAIGARDVQGRAVLAPSTHDRLRQLSDALDDGLTADTAGLAKLLSSRAGTQPIFRVDHAELPWVVRCATLATVVFDVPSGRMWLRADGGPDAPLEPVV